MVTIQDWLNTDIRKSAKGFYQETQRVRNATLWRAIKNGRAQKLGVVAHIRRPYFMLQDITQFGSIRLGKNVCV